MGLSEELRRSSTQGVCSRRRVCGHRKGGKINKAFSIKFYII